MTRFISSAGKHRQPWIFLEAAVGQRKLAQKEDRAPVRFDAPGVNAVRAESGPRRGLRLSRWSDHGSGYQPGGRLRLTSQNEAYRNREPCLDGPIRHHRRQRVRHGYTQPLNGYSFPNVRAGLLITRVVQRSSRCLSCELTLE